ncbi:MAG: DUF1796 family putative cysteine peptidase [Leptolyngbyaceae cyanobacterium bins.349]|nr:DUF1796 family putative cysteine peptidase [Leptolyngbyaceae cyanobacterium bins.349]
MYRFQIKAVTQPGETIALVGSTLAMGSWDEAQRVPLQTRGDRYPLWWVDLEVSAMGAGASRDRPIESKVEYKYVKIGRDGQVMWEALGANRWVPIEPEPQPLVIVEDGEFGIIRPDPYGYLAAPPPQPSAPNHPAGLKIVVIGSSVALGCSAWLLRGWAWHLGQSLQQQYGHHLVNGSAVGANVGTTIARFAQMVAPEQPDVVIIALSLGNEGLAASPPQQYRAIQRRFENGLQQLLKLTQEIGARPVLGAVYPHGDYSLEHYRVLRDTHQRLLTWGVPVLDWLATVDDGKGRWQAGLSYDSAHPNAEGHYRMYTAIDPAIWHLPTGDRGTQAHPPTGAERRLYQDAGGFLLSALPQNGLRIVNTSSFPYTITPDWRAFQTALRAAQVPAGLYMATAKTGTVSSLFVRDDGQIHTVLTVPPATDLNFHPAFHFFAQTGSQVLFYDGHLGILKISDRRLYVINDSDHEYNIHPMWKDVRAALKAMPTGVYEDAAHPEAPFRTMMIGPDGLESRVKIPAQSVIGLDYQCSLAAIRRVAIIPLGDRCAVRMLLYKLEYDGPAFPFDLTRTTNLGDVADMVQNDFYDMWNPHWLHYNHEARRIYHRKWTGLSFAHEVEDSDDPVNDMTPVLERMRTRYSARAKRFWYTLQKCDKALFVRTGVCDRGSVMDLVYKLQMKCQGKQFRLLLISPQASDEFAQLPNVLHYNLEFNPDRMYEDLGHWQYCTEVMRGILDSLGISSQNLFWCPPNPPTA